MPGEWEPHQATWLAWPHNPKDWPGKFAAMHWVYVEIVRHLSACERVEILIKDAALQRRVEKMLTDAHVDLNQVGLHLCPTIAPGPATRAPPSSSAGANSKPSAGSFNAWAKYDNWKADDAKVPHRIAGVAGCPASRQPGKAARVVLEGGPSTSTAGAHC